MTKHFPVTWRRGEIITQSPCVDPGSKPETLDAMRTSSRRFCVVILGRNSVCQRSPRQHGCSSLSCKHRCLYIHEKASTSRNLNSGRCARQSGRRLLRTASMTCRPVLSRFLRLYKNDVCMIRTRPHFLYLGVKSVAVEHPGPFRGAASDRVNSNSK